MTEYQLLKLEGSQAIWNDETRLALHITIDGLKTYQYNHNSLNKEVEPAT